MGVLTRQEMEAAIKAGGSVLHKGVIHWKVEHLPSEADLAAGDPQQEAIVAAALDTQIAALQQQRDRLALSGQSPMIGPPHAGGAVSLSEPPAGDPPTTEPVVPFGTPKRPEHAEKDRKKAENR